MIYVWKTTFSSRIYQISRDIYIDENLTWQRHTQYVYQRVQSRLHCLYCLCPLPNRLLGRLYCTFVLPLLDYCDVVWSSSSVQFLEDLNVDFVHWFLPYKDFPAVPWLNVMLLLLFIELFIGFHHCIWQILLGMLQLLPPTLEETIIVYLCLESGLHMAKTVFIIREHKFECLHLCCNFSCSII